MESSIIFQGRVKVLFRVFDADRLCECDFPFFNFFSYFFKLFRVRPKVVECEFYIGVNRMELFVQRVDNLLALRKLNLSDRHCSHTEYIVYFFYFDSFNVLSIKIDFGYGLVVQGYIAWVVVPKFLVAVANNIESLNEILYWSFQCVAVGHIIVVSNIAVPRVWRVILHNTSKDMSFYVRHISCNCIFFTIGFYDCLYGSKLGSHMAQHTYHIFVQFVCAWYLYKSISIPHPNIKISTQ